jgi:Fe2+ transport system protein FeoA
MVLHFMAKLNKVVPKKGRGRPATGRDPVTAIRISEELRANVDSWAAAQDDQPGRSEAIRRLVEMGLHAGASAESVRAQTKASDYATQASELAEELGWKAKGK